MGSATNIHKLFGTLNWPLGITYVSNIVYTADTGNKRITRISFTSRTMFLLLWTGRVGIEGVAAYRGRIYFNRDGFHQIKVASAYSGLWIVFLGATTAGDSITVGSVAFNMVYGLSADCSRKTLFVTEKIYGLPTTTTIPLGSRGGPSKLRPDGASAGKRYVARSFDDSKRPSLD